MKREKCKQKKKLYIISVKHFVRIEKAFIILKLLAKKKSDRSSSSISKMTF